jgi:hypothetical protein
MKTKYIIPLIFAFVLGLGWPLAGDDVVGKYALLVPGNGGGVGFCTVKQDGKDVWAKVTVLNFTPTSSGTAWIKFDGSTVGRLDGTFSDESMQAVFEGHFIVDKDVMKFSFDVRDHGRDINDIGTRPDMDADTDLTTELTNPSSNAVFPDGVKPTSIKMGTCTFVNSLNNN